MELSYISGNENPQRFLIFQEVTEKKVHLEKMSYTSRNRSPQKTSYIFFKRKSFLYFRKWKPRKNSLYFRKRNFLMLQETFYI